MASTNWPLPGRLVELHLSSETQQGVLFIWNVSMAKDEQATSYPTSMATGKQQSFGQNVSPQWACCCRSGLWADSAAMVCKVCFWICLALLYKKTPMNTRTVPVALRMVIWLLNTMMLSQIDRACFTVLATLRRRGEERRVVTGGNTAWSGRRNRVETTGTVPNLWLDRKLYVLMTKKKRYVIRPCFQVTVERCVLSLYLCKHSRCGSGGPAGWRYRPLMLSRLSHYKNYNYNYKNYHYLTPVNKITALIINSAMNFALSCHPLCTQSPASPKQADRQRITEQMQTDCCPASAYA